MLAGKVDADIANLESEAVNDRHKLIFEELRQSGSEEAKSEISKYRKEYGDIVLEIAEEKADIGLYSGAVSIVEAALTIIPNYSPLEKKMEQYLFKVDTDIFE